MLEALLIYHPYLSDPADQWIREAKPDVGQHRKAYR